MNCIKRIITFSCLLFSAQIFVQSPFHDPCQEDKQLFEIMVNKFNFNDDVKISLRQCDWNFEACCAWLQQYNHNDYVIYIDEDFCALPEEEKCFVLAHELSHIKNNDSRSILLSIEISKYISFGLLFPTLMAISQDLLRRQTRCYTYCLSTVFTASIASILYHLYRARQCEYNADATAASIIGNRKGGVNYLRNTSKNASTSFELFSTHPSYANRINALKDCAANI